MIPYALDPSLHTAEPESAVLDDGFAPPPLPAAGDDAPDPIAPDLDPRLWAKSEF